MILSIMNSITNMLYKSRESHRKFTLLTFEKFVTFVSETVLQYKCVKANIG